jgi:hypothetical protein
MVEDAPPDEGARGVVDERSMLIGLELGIKIGELKSAIAMGACSAFPTNFVVTVACRFGGLSPVSGLPATGHQIELKTRVVIMK